MLILSHTDLLLFITYHLKNSSKENGNSFYDLRVSKDFPQPDKPKFILIND